MQHKLKLIYRTFGAKNTQSCTRYRMVISRWRIVLRQKGRCEDFDYYCSL